METYPESEKFKKKFPKLWDYAKKVEIIKWQDEFNIADYNPEVIDEIKFLKMLFNNKMISQEEYMKKMKTLPIASKTIGIAFMDEDKVSFRNERPSFRVIVHELGHCYYKAPDRLWSSSYPGGGESILWLIYNDKLEGDEDTIEAWIDLIKLSYEDRKKAMKFLDELALKIAKKYKIEFEGNKRPIVELMRCAGTLPSSTPPMPFLFYENIIGSLKWGDTHYDVFAEELFEELKKKKGKLQT
jgi:hypothetical protein